MRRFLSRFLKDRSGATAVEYALFGGLMAVIMIGAATAMGSSLSSRFDGISNFLK